MVVDCFEQVAYGSQLVRAIGSWLLIGYRNRVMASDWLEQVGHGSQLVDLVIVG